MLDQNQPKVRYTLKREELLKRKKVIDSLFAAPISFSVYPLLWFYTLAKADSPYPAQVAVTVSKRKFKRAVDRNKIKRLIREAYRLEKPHFYEKLPKNDQQYAIMFIYTANEILDFESIHKKMQKGMEKFLEKVAQ